jgi:ferredoxin
MQTNFTEDQLRDPDVASSNQVLRTCVHCGFCTATCPTFVLLGDELDSPRGRIYLIKDMLESGRDATEEVVTHVDRCLSCLSTMPGRISRTLIGVPGRTGRCARCWRFCCRDRRCFACPCWRGG